jgi:hypothetical protein
VASTAPAVIATSTSANNNDDLYRDATPTNQPVNSDTTSPISPTSPTSPNSSKGLKSIFSKLKRRSKHGSAGTISTADMGKDKEQTGFVGGASLRSSMSQQQSQPTSAVAATTTTSTSDDEIPHNLGDVEPSPVVPSYVPHVDELDGSDSDVSSLSDYEEPMTRGRSAERIVSLNTKASGGTDSEFQEAQDHFDEGLAPPPTFTTDADKSKGSPNRDSKFREVGI